MSTHPTAPALQKHVVGPTWPPSADTAAALVAAAAHSSGTGSDPSEHRFGAQLSTATLSIQHTWNHQPVAEAERTQVRVTQHVMGVQVIVDAPFFGDVAPPAATGVTAGATPGLWQFEVVEVFFLGHDDRYLEVELSPHGNHLVLALEGVRSVVAEGLPLRYSAQILGPRWHGRAFMPAPLLPPDWNRLNAFAIHGEGTHRQYQAWRPAGGSKPDFHVLSAFGFWRDVCQ